ncbi:MAG TPA: XdhC family protein [Blastocatellia bacterium]
MATLLSQSGKCIKFAFDKDSTLSDCECDGFEERAVFRIAKEALASRLATEIVRMAGPNGEFTVSVEVIRPKPSIIIFGAGHVGRSLALIASLAGYEVTVIDDREEFVTRERFPNKEIHLIAGPYDEATYRVTVSPGTAVVIVTRGHQYDEQCLKDTIDSAAGYIGMIGSKRRVIAVYRRLEAAGINPERLKRVHAPIGLAIGARSPQEIAVAILAEIIQTLNSPA